MTTVISGTPKFLLIKDGYGRWGIPKGHIELNESSEQAAVREVREETGAQAEVIKKLGDNQYYFQLENRLIRKKVDVYLMRLTGSADLQPETTYEVEEVAWVDADKALKRVSYKNLRPFFEAALDTLESHGKN